MTKHYFLKYIKKFYSSIIKHKNPIRKGLEDSFEKTTHQENIQMSSKHSEIWYIPTRKTQRK